MEDLKMLEVPLRKADILGQKQSALLLSSMNQYDENEISTSKNKGVIIKGASLETDIFDSALGAYSSHPQFNDFVKIQDPYDIESDLEFDSNSSIVDDESYPIASTNQCQTQNLNASSNVQKSAKKKQIAKSDIEEQEPIQKSDVKKTSESHLEKQSIFKKSLQKQASESNPEEQSMPKKSSKQQSSELRLEDQNTVEKISQKQSTESNSEDQKFAQNSSKKESTESHSEDQKDIDRSSQKQSLDSVKQDQNIIEKSSKKSDDILGPKNQSKKDDSNKKPFFDAPKENNSDHLDLTSASYVDSYAYESYSYTFSVEYDVKDESSEERVKNEKDSRVSNSHNRLSSTYDVGKNDHSVISDEELQKFKKSNMLSMSHDIKKMNVNSNCNDDKDHVSWTLPQNSGRKENTNETSNIQRTADIYKVDLNEDDEVRQGREQSVVVLDDKNNCNGNDNNSGETQNDKPKFSMYFLVDASYQMVEDKVNVYENVHNNDEYEYEYEEEDQNEKEDKKQEQQQDEQVEQKKEEEQNEQAEQKKEEEQNEQEEQKSEEKQSEQIDHKLEQEVGTNETLKIETAPESEARITDQKVILQAPSTAAASSFVDTSSSKSNNSANPTPVISEPSIENKRKSPRGRKVVKFGLDRDQNSIENNENLDMFSESVCALSGSERECYKIEDVSDFA